MKNIVLSSCLVLGTLSMGSAAFACDRHGAGFGGYGMRNAQWQSYDPQVTTTDPALTEDRFETPIPVKAAVPPKAKPSFSNAANNASAKAKVRLAKKVNGNEKAASKKKPT